MAQESYSISVPGSMMLMGEHAVLTGRQAIVCAIQKYIHISLYPTSDNTITIKDTNLGEITTDINSLKIEEPFRFVTGVILQFKNILPSGFMLEINSEFSSTIGLGSSSAVTIGTIGILNLFCATRLTDSDMLDIGKKVLLDVQGIGSGADLAASLYGGVIAYTLDSVVKLPIIPNLTAIYCGYKTKTATVIAIVKKAIKRDTEKFEAIFKQMHTYALLAIDAIKESRWQDLGALFSKHQQLQVALGTSDANIEQLIKLLEQQPNILGAKISGSGLGDCVIGLGELNSQIIPNKNGLQQFTVAIAEKGLKYANN